MFSENLNLLKETIKRNYIKFIVMTITYSVIQFFLVILFIAWFTNYINFQIDSNINEYDEVDQFQLCRISNCAKLRMSDGRIFKPNTNGVLEKADNFDDNSIFDFEGISILKSGNVLIKNKKANTEYILTLKKIKQFFIKDMSIIIVMFVLFELILLLASLKEERKTLVTILSNNESILMDNTMITLTENIHHELNTPLTIIENKIEKIKRIVDTECDDEINVKDFYFINQSLEQIYGVLERMRAFKALRHDKENKTLYDIIDGALNALKISNAGFDYFINDKLKNYKLVSTNFSNIDLLNILINHFKNSLEANTSKIYVSFIQDDLFFDIILKDNGNGIKNKNKINIFKPNFSTKAEETTIRGNGLYINKTIMNGIGGDIELVETSNKGTTFIVKIPMKDIICSKQL